MATFTAALNTRELVGGYDLSTYFGSAGVPKSKETAETTTFRATAKTRVGVLKDGAWNVSGYLDESTSGGAGVVLSQAFADDALEISHYPNDDTAGNTGFGLQTVQTNYEMSAPVAGVVECSAEAESNRAAERLTSLRALASSSGGTSSVTDNAGSTTAGYAAYLHLTAAGAAGTIEIQHSADNNTYGTLATFTAHATSPTSQRLYGTAQVDRYVKVVHIQASSTATFQVGLSRQPCN